MSNYNYFERSFARVLSRAPFIKRIAKKLYSRLVYYGNKKSFDHKVRYNIEVVCDAKESFFGYYDKMPANKDGLVLAHLTDNQTSRAPSSYDSNIKVALFSEKLNKVIWTGSTGAYNWQQGARLHWISNSLFVYNDFSKEKQRYIAKVISTKTLDKVSEYDYPVQDSFNSDYFLSINYSRLRKLRPDYGYHNAAGTTEVDLNDLNNDGIWRVDYKTGSSTLLVTIAEMCELSPKLEFGSALHKANHVMISPDGTRFIFMHRYLIGKKRFDRLILADASTGKLMLVGDYGMVSHCFWVDNKKIMGYMRGPGNRDGYWLIDLETLDYKPLLHDKLAKFGDGHPHVHGDWFVTDTYPDKARMQHLLLCNLKTSEVIELGEFFHGFEYSGESRCDLHPRFSPDGKSLFFDSVFSGKRQLYRMELPA